MANEIVGVFPVHGKSRNGIAFSGVRVFMSSPIDPLSGGKGYSFTEEMIFNKEVDDIPLGPCTGFNYEKQFNGSYRCTGIIPNGK